MADSVIGVTPIRNWVFINIYDDGGLHKRIGNTTLYMPQDHDFSNPNSYSHEHKHRGIRPRWALVLAVSDYAEQCGVEIGDKILCDQMKWTRSFQYDREGRRCWAIDADDILLVDESGLTEDEVAYINGDDHVVLLGDDE